MNTVACLKCGEQTTNVWSYCDACPSFGGAASIVLPNQPDKRRVSSITLSRMASLPLKNFSCLVERMMDCSRKWASILVKEKISLTGLQG